MKMQRKIKYPPNLYTIKNPTNLYKIKYWRLVRLELYFRPKLIQIQIYLLSPNDWHRLHLPQLMSAICGQHYKWHYTIWCYKGSLVSRLKSACCKYTARLVTYFCLIRGHVEMNLTIWLLENFATLFFMTPQSQIEVINSNISIVFIIVSIIYLFIISTNHFSAPFWSWTYD